MVLKGIFDDSFLLPLILGKISLIKRTMRVRVRAHVRGCGCACVCACVRCAYVSPPHQKVEPPSKKRPPFKKERPPVKKIEVRFSLQQAGVENQKKPQVNILDCWFNTSKTSLNEVQGKRNKYRVWSMDCAISSIRFCISESCGSLVLTSITYSFRSSSSSFAVSAGA